MKKAVCITVSIFLLLFATAYTASAVSSGSQGDPLVTLGYLTDVFAPKILSDVKTSINSSVATIKSDIDKKLADFENNYLKNLSSGNVVDDMSEKVLQNIQGTVSIADFKVVKLEKGQVMAAGPGCRFILRVGTVSALTSSYEPLINLTNATELAKGKNLVANNLYITTSDALSGIVATSDTAYALVAGQTVAGGYKGPDLMMQLNNKSMVAGYTETILDVAPLVENGRTLVPVRAPVEAMGGSVLWNQEEMKATLTLGSNTVEIWVGRDYLLRNGERVTLDVPAKAIGGRTLLPLRAAFENLGCRVEYNSDFNKIFVYKK